MAASSSTISSVCIHDTHLVLGGVAGARFSGSDWLKLFNEWRHHAQDDVLTFAEQNLDTNWLIWSETGGGEVYWPFIGIMNALGFDLTANFVQVEDALKEQIARGWMGMIPLETKGKVQVLKPLGANIACYTEDAVYLILNTEQGYRSQRILRHGVAGRGAVAGDRNGHVFIDFNSEAWSLSSGGELRRLGFREYLQTLDKATLVCSHDSRYNDYYACDSERGFLLAEGTALSELTAGFPSSLLRSDQGELVGTVVGAVSDEFSLVACPIDLDFSGLKSMSFLEVDFAEITELSSRFSWRMTRTKPFMETQWQPANDDGIFYHGLSFNELKLQLKGKLGADAKLERAILRINYQDNRTVRGPRGTNYEVQSG